MSTSLVLAEAYDFGTATSGAKRRNGATSSSPVSCKCLSSSPAQHRFSCNGIGVQYFIRLEVNLSMFLSILANSHMQYCHVTNRILCSTFLVGINSTSITSVAQEINREFDIQDVTIPNSYWPVTAWNGGAAIMPMIVVPLLEQYGVRIGYIV